MPEFSDQVRETWKLPETWKLHCQLVFGQPKDGLARSREREYSPLEDRVKVFGSWRWRIDFILQKGSWNEGGTPLKNTIWSWDVVFPWFIVNMPEYVSDVLSLSKWYSHSYRKYSLNCSPRSLSVLLKSRSCCYCLPRFHWQTLPALQHTLHMRQRPQPIGHWISSWCSKQSQECTTQSDQVLSCGVEHSKDYISPQTRVSQPEAPWLPSLLGRFSLLKSTRCLTVNSHYHEPTNSVIVCITRTIGVLWTIERSDFGEIL